MQKSNPSKKLTRDAFLEEAEKRVRRITNELSELHGGPPCPFAFDVNDVKSWSNEKREKMLATIRAASGRAEQILREAQQERTSLWEQSDAADEDKLLPPIIPFKQIREDLESYEETLRFVRPLAKMQ